MTVRWNHRLKPTNTAGAVRVLGWVVLAGGIGGLTGHLLHRTLSSAAVTTMVAKLRATANPQSANFPPYTTPGWGLRDEIDLATLREAPAGVRRTAETALWLGRATPEEIAGWWPTLAAEKPQDEGLLDGVMTRWMELAPLAALTQVTGTPEEFRAWWAWGKVNPVLAMERAKTFKSGHLWRVIQGAGTSDPLTAIRLAEENPAAVTPAVEEAIKDGLKSVGWRDSLEYRYDAVTLRSWANYEPDRAFEWALAHASKVHPTTWSTLVSKLDESDPGEVAQAVAKLPTGLTRQTVLLAHLEWTAARDLQGALVMAAAAESPALRTRMLSLIGKNLASSDPTRSLALFREVLEQGGEPNTGRILAPEAEEPLRATDDTMATWRDLLLEHDPAKVLEIARAMGETTLEDRAKTAWLNHDFAGYTAHLRELPEGAHRDRELDGVASFLTSGALASNPAAAFPDALDWAAAITNPTLRGTRVSSVINWWLDRDQESAAAYFAEDGDATAEQRAVYQEMQGGAQ